MTQVQILEELKKFTIPDRLTIVEATLRLIREDLQEKDLPLSQEEKRHQLAAAAKALLPDYAVGGELTIFGWKSCRKQGGPRWSQWFSRLIGRSCLPKEKKSTTG